MRILRSIAILFAGNAFFAAGVLVGAEVLGGCHQTAAAVAGAASMAYGLWVDSKLPKD